MILGLGNDIISVSRIKKVIEKHGLKFLERTFTAHERDYCEQHVESFRNYAGRFAAKEAIVKAIGTGFSDSIVWLDMEIHNDPHGKPFVILSDKLKTRLGSSTVLISISHCDEYATAVAIITREAC